ncbi:MAG: AAA family ATPase [Muribaculaceae bacterium]|nr:AAA family ATPase [Muribaculaceae bacterium]
MKPNNKYEEAFLANAMHLDAITQSNGRIFHCAEKIIQHYEADDTIDLLGYITRYGKDSDLRKKTVAIVLKDSLFMLYGNRGIEDIYYSKKAKIVGEEEKTLKELLQELNELVGLEKVKQIVNDLICYQQVQKLRRDNGLSSPERTLHLAFIGNPGTGKTTVARIVGRIYKQIGVLSKGHFTEVSRTDLIAGYQGQTALKVKKVIEKAKGGVLFIDEAYSITENDHSDSYGRECLTELTKALEDYRDDLVVIVAGYTAPMEKFFESNPGLKSRFNTFIYFDDYNADELMSILKHLCSKDNYTLSTPTQDILSQRFRNIADAKIEQFANGRYIRNIFEEMIMNHARRVARLENPTKSQLEEMIIDDVPDENQDLVYGSNI